MRIDLVVEGVTGSTLSVVRPVIILGIRIACLNDESFYDPMKPNAVIEIVGGEFEEIVYGLWCVIIVKMYSDVAFARFEYGSVILLDKREVFFGRCLPRWRVFRLVISCRQTPDRLRRAQQTPLMFDRRQPAESVMREFLVLMFAVRAMPMLRWRMRCLMTCRQMPARDSCSLPPFALHGFRCWLLRTSGEGESGGQNEC